MKKNNDVKDLVSALQSIVDTVDKNIGDNSADDVLGECYRIATDAIDGVILDCDGEDQR